jgi:hypothetical protein
MKDIDQTDCVVQTYWKHYRSPKGFKQDQIQDLIPEELKGLTLRFRIVLQDGYYVETAINGKEEMYFVCLWGLANSKKDRPITCRRLGET